VRLCTDLRGDGGASRYAKPREDVREIALDGLSLKNNSVAIWRLFLPVATRLAISR
jgi:hypothetical protein